jgi:hypothetical protein
MEPVPSVDASGRPPNNTYYDWEYENHDPSHSLSVSAAGLNWTDGDPMPSEAPWLEWDTIQSTFKEVPACQGNLTVTSCNITYGMVEYPVTLSNGTIALRYPHWQNDTQIPLYVPHPHFLNLHI